MIPPRPDRFDPETPPPGFELKLISFWRDRPIIVPRLQLIHTNAASGEGTVESAYNWANQPGSGHTIPHFQIDRSGRAAMLLPLNRKGIANYLAAGFSLGYETADTGTNADPTISAFTEKQAEQVAVACAYASVLYNIPLAYPEEWAGSGTACHTEPFGYPTWTNSVAKFCPGSKKKAQVRDVILPRAREIVAAWTAPPTPPTPPPPLTEEVTDEMWLIVKTKNPDGSTGPWFAAPRIRGGAHHVPTEVPLEYVFAAGGGMAFDLGSLAAINNGQWAAAPVRLTKEQALVYLGAEV